MKHSIDINDKHTTSLTNAHVFFQTRGPSSIFRSSFHIVLPIAGCGAETTERWHRKGPLKYYAYFDGTLNAHFEG